MKKNRWIVVFVCVLMFFTPTVALARGFHGGGHIGGDHFGGGHTTHTFHDDEGTGGHTFHDDNEDEDGTHTHLDDDETDDEPQSLGSRVKDTVNYLIPRSWHGHHSRYYHVDSATYYDNQETALDQLIDWLEDLCVVYFVFAVVWAFIPEKCRLKVAVKRIKNMVSGSISGLLGYNGAAPGKHAMNDNGSDGE
ncbi:hypothetical protein [Ligilactobacillus hohenheimensis]|uniref:hypothetical protein n=1 Tax=Ligilactobacillus hohenheimensis TaxID=2991832 RepID=UPI0024BB73DD|nr:hypothetical protein [Ligilactobacillus hohenheimensis]